MASPASFVGSQPDPDERRTAPRFKLPENHRGEIGVFQPLTVKEVGPGGALVESSFPLQLDSLHDLRLTLGKQTVVVKGRVAHSRIVNVGQEGVLYQSGLEFAEVSDRIQSVILRFVEGLTSERPNRKR